MKGPLIYWWNTFVHILSRSEMIYKFIFEPTERYLHIFVKFICPLTLGTLQKIL